MKGIEMTHSESDCHNEYGIYCGEDSINDPVLDLDDETEWGEYESPQEVCPKCQSDNIANEDAAEADMLPVTCHNCGYQWVEPEVQ